jgi:hypothetical protein
MRVGFALRSSVFHPSLIVKIAPLLERAKVDSIWFPDAGMAFDALDLCALALGSTRRVRVGTGVIRAGEQDPARLSARVLTLSEASEGRFILGLGAGMAHGPAAVGEVVALAEKLRAGYRGERKPPIFFAALRGGMLRAALSSADGAILNFCPPSHVERIVPKGGVREGFEFACYIKLFFAKSGATARRMLVQEVTNYNSYPSYHRMFEAAGVADSIAGLGRDSLKIPDRILEISLPNPTKREVAQFLGRFARAGVSLPIIYPYVSGSEGYQLEVVRMLASVAAAVK